jgi:hypothetical protein
MMLITLSIIALLISTFIAILGIVFLIILLIEMFKADKVKINEDK